MRSRATCQEWRPRQDATPIVLIQYFGSEALDQRVVNGVRVVTLSSYLDIKARSRLLMKGSFVVATKSRKTWARCLLNSLSNMG